LHAESSLPGKTTLQVESDDSRVGPDVAFCNTTTRWCGKSLRLKPSRHAEEIDQATPL